MTGLVIVWVVLFLALIVFVSPRPGMGGPLTFAYFLALSIIHVPGALSYIGGAMTDSGLEPTLVGFRMTLIGLAAFVAGAALSRGPQPLAVWRGRLSGDGIAVQQLGTRIIVLGAVAFVVIQPLLGSIATVASVVSTLSQLLVIGLWLRLYASVTLRNRRGIILTLAILPLLPLVTIASAGFVGYGISWVISVVALLFVLARGRTLILLATPVVLYLGLSFFVTYAGQRNEIREVVWSGRASIMERVDSVARMVTSFEPLDLADDVHARHLRNRLNQNLLVGVGVIRHQNDTVDLAYGATFQPWLLIPRVLWPGKPDIGGSGNIVTSFTGINFSAGTSVGAGQVLEFYYNFGIVGVVLGFFGLGYLLRLLDRRLMTGLVQGDLRLLLLNGMPGLALLQPGGSVIEIAAATIAALVAAHVVLAYDRHRRRGPASGERPRAARPHLPLRR
ncbi:MAG: hypothetical protein KIT43_05320 [Bauldia sp.]|nr:hypothetical protein [Bauldia sp.]